MSVTQDYINNKLCINANLINGTRLVGYIDKPLKDSEDASVIQIFCPHEIIMESTDSMVQLFFQKYNLFSKSDFIYLKMIHILTIDEVDDKIRQSFEKNILDRIAEKEHPSFINSDSCEDTKKAIYSEFLKKMGVTVH